MVKQNKFKIIFIGLIFTLAILLFMPIIYGTTNLNNSLIHYYSYDVNANDSIGVLDGTVTGVTHITDGQKLGSGAYNYTGTAYEYITYGSANIFAGKSNFSVSLWINIYSKGLYHTI